MLELALEPGFIAVGCTVIGGVVFKAVETRLNKNKVVQRTTGPREHRMTRSQKKHSNSKTEFDCAVYSVRLFEQRLVDAGITKVSEMTVCDDDACVNCKSTNDARRRAQQHEIAEKNRANMVKAREERRLYDRQIEKNESEWEAFQRLKRTDKRYAGYTYADYKFQQDIKRRQRAQNELKAKPIEAGKDKPLSVVKPCEVCGQLTERDGMCLPCRQDAAQARDAELVKRNAQHMHGRWTEIGGMRILRPRNVPSFADFNLGYDANRMADYILWTWQYADTKVCQKIQWLDVESHSTTDGNGVVVSEWQAVTDPDTGEHLGDYRRTADGKTLLRSRPKNLEKVQDYLTEALLRNNSVVPIMMEAPEIRSRKGIK